MADNSPAFQRWAAREGRQVPEGRQKYHQRNATLFRPFGTRELFEPDNPALKRRAILTVSLRDKGDEFPKDIRAKGVWFFAAQPNK
jgi:hypothetical protein